MATVITAIQVKIAVTGSLVINILLAVIQIYAAVSSLSLSFFATAIDAIFDPCANLILGYAHRKAEKVDLNKYPSVSLSSPHPDLARDSYKVWCTIF